MKEDLLSEVVEVEKEVARNLETAKIEAQEMLDNLRQASAQEISEEEKRLQEALNQAIISSDLSAEKKAADILRKADTTASRLEKTGDEALKGIIRKYIPGILP